MSQLGMSTLSRSNRCKIIKFLYDCEKEMLLIPEILDAIDLRVYIYGATTMAGELEPLQWQENWKRIINKRTRY